MSITYEQLKDKFFVMAGPNVIESDEHVMSMAQALKRTFSIFDVHFIFKVSWDKANRTSLNSYRGVGFQEGCRILAAVKHRFQIPLVTDIHEPWQAKIIGRIVDVIQIPAFLCRQTDLLKAAAETGKIIHIKKGQMCSAAAMHKAKEKLIAFGNPNVILCERGNTFGYQDLVVDPRNLIWLKSDTNLVSMDITHCLQAPAQKLPDGTVKAGGHRELIPYMGKMAVAMGVNGIFMEVHDRPDESLCDAPTQWYLDRLPELLDDIGIDRKHSMTIGGRKVPVTVHEYDPHKAKILCCIPTRYESSRLPGKPLLKINGKTIIELSHHQAQKTFADKIVVLTDDERIREEVELFGGNCALITDPCDNGTDRIIAYLKTIDHSEYDIILNLQGDEPFVNPDHVNQAIENFMIQHTEPDRGPLACSTICVKSRDAKEIGSRSRGKAVLDQNSDILYCSRNVVPATKTGNINPNIDYNLHIGIFVYDKDYLLHNFVTQNTPLQMSEDIEWLKIIEQEFRINTIFVDSAERGIDTREDYEYLLDKYSVSPV